MPLVSRRGAVAARVSAAGQDPTLAVDGDAVGVAGELVPVAPPVQRMAAARELVDGRLRIARLDVQRVACFAEREASGEPARQGERLLDVLAEIDHRDVGLHVNLWLAVG